MKPIRMLSAPPVELDAPSRAYRLVVPLKPPSKNDVKPDMGITRMGSRLVPTAWLRVKRLEEAWERALARCPESFAPTGRRRVTFTRVLGKRERPYDVWNLAGGLNSVVVDILVRYGWLLDDRPDAADLPLPLQIRGDDPRAVVTGPATIIVVRELNASAPVDAVADEPADPAPFYRGKRYAPVLTRFTFPDPAPGS